MIRFVHPEAFLLAVPALWWLGRVGRGRPLVLALRITAFALLLALLAEPYRTSADAGRDLVVVVDRSRSVGGRALDRARELLDAARDVAEPGDRIGVVTFGKDSALEVAPTDPLAVRLDRPGRAVDPDGTDLSAAVDRALAAIPPGRRGSILVVSDGEATGGSPMPAVRAALRRGVRVDVVPIRRPGGVEVAVEELALPGEVHLGEPFRVVAWVRSDRAARVPFRLVRDGETIASGERDLLPGPNRLVFRDAAARPGLCRYEVQLDVEGDRVHENDRALGVLRVDAPRRLLLVSPDGRRGRLAQALEGLGIAVDVAPPRAAPLSLDGLEAFAAVVLENVAAEDLPDGAFDALSTFVEDLGGGLSMTGGTASFGVGGYRRSAIEDLLPVSMEVREEQRRFALAMAIALDRSGSMAAPAGGNRTKMDLANLGTIAALEMLGPNDEVAVIAVDSAPHVVVPLAPMKDLDAVAGRVRTIESGGGGIFVGVALEQMAAELAKSTTRTRHMVLFADAADSEEPGDYRTLVPKLRDAGITLSVIALGEPTDSDAALLLELARLGGGRCKFVAEAQHLPRLFAQEAIEVARASFAEEPTAVAVLPDLLALGDVGFASFPSVGGYSIAWAKPDATVGLQTADDTKAPLLAFWQRGLGRAAAFLGEVDGAFTGDLGAWDGFGGFFATLGRYLTGAHGSGDVWAALRREGHHAVLTVELTPEAEGRADAIRAVALGPSGTKELWLERTGPRRLEARFVLEREGVHRAAVQVGSEVLRVAPVALPYSPEFEPRLDPADGERTLARMAEIAEGRVDPPAAELMDGRRDSAGFEPLGEWFAWLALVAVLLEIAVRRLELRVGTPAWVRRLWRARRARIAVAAAPARAQSAPPTPSPTPPQPADLGSVLDRARRRARGEK